MAIWCSVDYFLTCVLLFLSINFCVSLPLFILISKLRELTRPYRDGWEVLEGSSWVDFHNQWWGGSWEENLSGELHIQDRICEELEILQGKDGILFQRAEYRAFSNCIQNAKAKLSHRDLFGYLLLGQPGVGKSVFLVFFLLRCMSKKQTVLFTNSSNTTFLINKRGIQRKSTNNFFIDDLPPTTTRVWSLVDSPREKIPPADSVTIQHPSKIFFIAALSPDEEGCHHLEKCMVATWWMSSWTEDELFDFLNILKDSFLSSYKNKFETLPAVQLLMEKAGPCPRDILHAIIRSA